MSAIVFYQTTLILIQNLKFTREADQTSINRMNKIRCVIYTARCILKKKTKKQY